jgi:hypothetical protein
MNVFHRRYFSVLRSRGAGDRNQRLAGRIRDQMQMEIAGDLSHDSDE